MTPKRLPGIIYVLLSLFRALTRYLGVWACVHGSIHILNLIEVELTILTILTDFSQIYVWVMYGFQMTPNDPQVLPKHPIHVI